ncbi:hypothetical protein SRB17_78270 [Streptomyces sp. RB17]|nr:hypothetical protein [Streptomyces sp. RB17]
MARLGEPVLRTQRLVMEPIRQGDSEDLFEAVVSQDSVMRWLATGRADSWLCHSELSPPCCPELDPVRTNAPPTQRFQRLPLLATSGSI